MKLPVIRSMKTSAKASKGNEQLFDYRQAPASAGNVDESHRQRCGALAVRRVDLHEKPTDLIDALSI